MPNTQQEERVLFYEPGAMNFLLFRITIYGWKAAISRPFLDERLVLRKEVLCLAGHLKRTARFTSYP
jgi:hypothetical protein